MPGKRILRGMTILEVMVTVLILAVAITAALSTFATHFRGSRMTEERRLAMQAAHAKMDELRLAIATGSSLEFIFQRYGPLDFEAVVGSGTVGVDTTESGEVIISDVGTTSGTLGLSIPLKTESGSIFAVSADGYLRRTDGTGDPTYFIVGEDINHNNILDVGEDLNENGRLDVYLDQIPGRPLGTISIINDETPTENQFGRLMGQDTVLTANWYESNPFGVDITGDRNFGSTAPSPFPLDINGDGDHDDNILVAPVNGGAHDKDDTYIVDGFRFLPIVVTIQWLGPYGHERIDLFSILAKEHP